MASISVAKYTSATSYTVTISGLTVGQKYHLFIEDLTSSGASNGWYCRYTQTATSTSYTYTGSTSATYSQYDRRVRLYGTGTTSTSHSVGTRYSTSELPSSNVTGAYTATIAAWGGGSSYSTNSIYFRIGAGISSYRMQYANATTEGLLSDYINSSYNSTVLAVRSGTNAALYGVSYADGYEAPFQFVEYSDSSFSTVKKYFDEGDGYVYSSGTRYIALTATKKAYWYRVRAFGNGGTFSGQGGADNYYTPLASSTTTSISFDLSTLEEPVRTGYKFLGWGYTSNATTYYKDQSIPISATSQSSSSPTIYNLYAIWEAIEYNAYVKLGAGISSAMVQVDGVSKVDIRDSAYHRVVVNLTSTITIASIGLQSGYGPPYTVRFYASATATTPSSSLSSSDTDVSYAYTTSRLYAEITATKESIDLFYWDSESTDSLLIAAGQPISNMTAARWNRFKAKIAELAAAEGGSYSYSTVASGDTFYATEFNAVRTAIMNRSSYGTLPAAQASGNAVKASLFEGSGSLKTALNAAITHYNNS